MKFGLPVPPSIIVVPAPWASTSLADSGPSLDCPRAITESAPVISAVKLSQRSLHEAPIFLFVLFICPPRNPLTQNPQGKHPVIEGAGAFQRSLSCPSFPLCVPSV